ncbi:unnamed protein product [Ranitomeya imitator]|uniref:Myosin motor domain-containing protein n=1 Tax=Ranitomeya imitator TaxID=111125 RepID=A0ABN9LNI9_9NEOB|nr:unnamed protein product [Ranitomeya imitator]
MVLLACDRDVITGPAREGPAMTSRSCDRDVITPWDRKLANRRQNYKGPSDRKRSASLHSSCTGCERRSAGKQSGDVTALLSGRCAHSQCRRSAEKQSAGHRSAFRPLCLHRAEKQSAEGQTAEVQLCLSYTPETRTVHSILSVVELVTCIKGKWEKPGKAPELAHLIDAPFLGCCRLLFLGWGAILMAPYQPENSSPHLRHTGDTRLPHVCHTDVLRKHTDTDNFVQAAGSGAKDAMREGPAMTSQSCDRDVITGPALIPTLGPEAETPPSPPRTSEWAADALQNCIRCPRRAEISQRALAFGNAKTAHNNNSSRFGKFIQVNYLESGIVRGVIKKFKADGTVANLPRCGRKRKIDKRFQRKIVRMLAKEPRLTSKLVQAALQSEGTTVSTRTIRRRLNEKGLYVWRRHPSNIRDLEQFAKEEWSKIPAEHCKKLIDGYRKRAVVEKYLLEKSRLVSQEKNERNYHVFYYLLLGASEEERKAFQLKQPEDYFYLNQNNFKIEEGEDFRHDFERLKQAMEMVGFLPATKKQIFSVLSAILYLGNVAYKKKASGRDEGLEVGPPQVLDTLSRLLQVKREMLVEALTKRKTVTVNEKLILPYSINEGKHRVTKRGPALSNPMFTLVTGIVGRWRAVCVTALQRPNSDAAAIRIVVGIAAASLSVTPPEEANAKRALGLHRSGPNSGDSMGCNCS